MRRFRNILILAVAAAAAGCLYQGEYVRDEPGYVGDEPQPYAPAPSAPGPDYSSSESYQSDPAPPPAGSDVPSDDVFTERLSPYGSWTFIAPYGRVWIPAVGYGWRPYYYGRWVLTDWGWTFVSDDPWGWAAYHYGRWNWGIGVGWYWIPGLTWGPAWVSWRYGGGYAAWCPLGPRGVYFGYRHPGWVAVQETHFTQPIARVAVPLRSTATVVSSAQPLTGAHATVARGGSFGPPVANVARATGQPVRPVSAAAVVARASRPTAGPSAVSRAGVNRSPMQQPRARAGSVGRAPAPAAQPGGSAKPASRPAAGPRARGGGGGMARAPAGRGGGHHGGGKSR